MPVVKKSVTVENQTIKRFALVAFISKTELCLGVVSKRVYCLSKNLARKLQNMFPYIVRVAIVKNIYIMPMQIQQYTRDV